MQGDSVAGRHGVSLLQEVVVESLAPAPSTAVSTGLSHLSLHARSETTKAQYLTNYSEILLKFVLVLAVLVTVSLLE